MSPIVDGKLVSSRSFKATNRFKWVQVCDEKEMIDVPIVASVIGYTRSYFKLMQAWVCEGEPDDVGVIGEIEWKDIEIEY